MKIQVISIVILIFFTVSAPMAAQDISQHEWKNRLLLILANENSKSLYRKQMDLLKENAEGLEERKMVIYTIMPDKYKKGLFSHSWKESADLNDRFREKNRDFEVILIGLDGGVKLRQTDVLSIEKLFSTIDAMPMRQREMRKNQKPD